MEGKRRSQIITVLALTIAVVALGVGFAAFSTSLTIKSSAEVRPDDSQFQVLFATKADGTGITSPYDEVNKDESGNPIVDGDGNTSTTQKYITVDGTPMLENGSTTGLPEGFKAEPARIDNTDIHAPKIENLHAIFTEPGQKVVYEFYSYNTGEYDAFLNDIIFKENAQKAINSKDALTTWTLSAADAASKKICSAGVDKNGVKTTEEYVQQACDFIDVSIEVGNTSPYTGVVKSSTDYTEHRLVKKTSEKIIVTITYRGFTEDDAAATITTGEGENQTTTKKYTGYARADGPFYISFGDIVLNYSSIDLHKN